jgi:hypothetical protein
MERKNGDDRRDGTADVTGFKIRPLVIKEKQPPFGFDFDCLKKWFQHARIICRIKAMKF